MRVLHRLCSTKALHRDDGDQHLCSLGESAFKVHWKLLRARVSLCCNVVRGRRVVHASPAAASGGRTVGHIYHVMVIMIRS